MRRGALALLLAFLPPAHGAQDSSSETAASFAKALQKLGSEEYSEREAASAEIAALPVEALRLIEAELKKGNLELEVRMRLERAVPALKSKAKRVAAARKKEAEAAWYRKTTTEAYQKFGRKDPKWDDQALEALGVVALVWAGTASPGQDRQGYELCLAAVEAGCDDPLVLYARARMYDVAIRKSRSEALELHLAAAQAMKEKGARYPGLRQCFCFARAAELLSRSEKKMSDEVRTQVQDWFDLALPRLSEAAADPEVPEGLLREAGGLMVVTSSKATQDFKVGFDNVFEALTKARPGSTLPLVLKGEAYIKYAWDARGSGWANTVTEDGWKKMRDRLDEAEQALTAAWKMNPEDPEAPTLMIGVELGQGKGRPAMETWYKRAMAANPDNRDACHRKMYYLEPKYHGSEEDMLNFGRELLAGGNWGARLPFYLVDAHLTLAGYAKDKPSYYKNEAVWKDFQSVYDPYLSLHPDSAWDRTYYAKLACWCGRWTEAKALFDKLGDKVVVSAFADRAELDRLRAEAADNSK